MIFPILMQEREQNTILEKKSHRSRFCTETDINFGISLRQGLYPSKGSRYLTISLEQGLYSRGSRSTSGCTCNP